MQVAWATKPYANGQPNILLVILHFHHTLIFLNLRHRCWKHQKVLIELQTSWHFQHTITELVML